MISLAVTALALLFTAVSPATDSAVRVQVSAASRKTVSDGQTDQSAAPFAASNDDIGNQVIAYARKYLGGPYRYGGTSLTNGTDCSGFVMSIYKHFGVNLPRTSRAMRKAGFKVKNLSKAKPGDILCYSGHVALYMGNNTIIHASNKKNGICIRKNAKYKKILKIRRIFK